MTITYDVQTLEPGEKVVLYELNSESIGGDILYFHGYQKTGSIWWQGKEYTPWAIQVDGFAKTGDGQQPTPTMQVGNIGLDADGNPVPGWISAMCILLDDLVGSKLTRHVTLGKYLDAVNFPEGNPSADPTQEFPPEVYYVEQKTEEDNESVKFTLTTALDFNNVQLPRRQIVNNSCSWLRIGGYRGSYCGYTGSAMFDEDGNVVSDPSLDRCGGRLSDCKKRFGQYEILNYGSFPAANLSGSSSS